MHRRLSGTCAGARRGWPAPVRPGSRQRRVHLCGACVEACGTGALQRTRLPPWDLRATVAGACLAGSGIVCASCREVCPAQAIRVPPGGRGAASVDALRCTGCGACVGVCPASAISLAGMEEACA
ncbi:4Fe-4S binding protein [Pseudoxanthomonas suwonensis]